MTRIGLDIDGVLADIIPPLKEILTPALGEPVATEPLHYDLSTLWPYRPEAKKYIEETFLYSQKVYGIAPPYQDAVAGVRILEKHGFLVAYITSRPLHMRWVTEQWLRQKGFPKAPVYCGRHKGVIGKFLELDILIDDNPNTLMEAIQFGIRPILIRRSYNRYAWEQFDSFDGIKSAAEHVVRMANGTTDVIEKWVEGLGYHI